MFLIILLCIGAVLCLAPITAYVAWLASLNRREHPTVIAGSWDFIALIAGLSGFLIFGGGLLVAGLQSNARSLVRGNWKQAQDALDADRTIWALTAGGYVITVAAGCGVAVLLRSRSLAVYNIDAEAAAAAVSAAVADAGVPAVRTDSVWSHGVDLVELQSFEGFRHVTVWMLAHDQLMRRGVEQALRKRLTAQQAATDNPAAAWLSSATICLFFSLIGFVFLIGYIGFVGR